MAAEGCHACMKYMLFIFNIFFWIVGLGILGLGIYSEVANTSDDAHIIDDTNHIYSKMIIGVGVLVSIIGFAGCWGACKESRGCLIFYAAMVFIVLCLEAAAAGLAYHYRNDLESKVKEGMTKTMNQYTNSSEDVVTRAWDNIQKKKSCCGVSNYTDWADSTWGKKNVGVLPMSCCKNSTTSCTTANTAPVHKKGCYTEVFFSLDKQWKLYAGIAAGIAVCQIFGVIFACCLQAYVKKAEYLYI